MGTELRRNSILPAGVRLKAYLEAAEGAGVVKILGFGDTASVELNDEHVLSDRPDASDSEGSQSPASSSSVFVYPIFYALLSVIEEMQDEPGSYVRFSTVGEALSRREGGNYRAAGYTRFRELADAAEAEELVETRRPYGAGSDEIRSLI
jgi:hypothetical protein